MRMSRLILLRIATLSLFVLAMTIVLVAWQAHRDVEHEARSARQVSYLIDTLSRLQGARDDDIPTHIRNIETILRSGELRHLDVRIQDARGRDLLVPPTIPHSRLQSLLFRSIGSLMPDHDGPPVEWTLRSSGGSAYHITLTTDPSSEQRESLVGILDTLTTLILFGTLIVLATYVSLRQVLSPLRGILHAIDGYRRHDYSRRAPPANTEEMSAIGSALNDLARELADMQEARRVLSMKLLTLQEDERAHLARELHDEFGQVLTAIRADAAWLAHRVRDQPELRAVADELRTHCDRASLDVRNLLRRLRPRVMDGDEAVPLQRMLEDLVNGWRARPGLEMQFELSSAIGDDLLPQSLALAVYRISQEALTNAARHAHARRVSITFHMDAAGTLHWEAVDDGVGMPASIAESQQGNGLAGMRERVWAHGGEIEIASPVAATGTGVRLHARFPHAAQTSATKGADAST